MTLELDPVDPAEMGMSTEHLRWADELMQRQFDEGRSPMLAAIVARHGRVVFTKTLGDHRPGGPPLTLDSMFPLASNGKPMTAATLLAVVERGLVGLTDPAEAYLPELAGNGNGDVLVHHLLTHTAGWDDDELMTRLGEIVAGGALDPPEGRDVLTHLFLTAVWDAPRARPAGELMQYSNFHYTLISEIIRRATGGTLHAAMRELVFDPADMTRSAVIVPDDLVPRVVERPPGIPHSPGHPNTVLAHADPLWTKSDDGGSGVHTSPVDNLRFLEMIRNGGMVGDQRVLSGAAVRAMTTNQIPGVSAKFGWSTLAEASWGYGFSVGGADPSPRFRGGTTARGALRHGGAGGISSWVDPSLGITGVYYDLLTEGDESRGPVSWAAERFEDVITASVVD
jgi:CubicO group peptidase (beta-lactamase class C family)